MCIEHSAIWENGKRVWKAYETLFVDGEDFEQIAADFEKEHAVRMTQIGNAAVRLMRQRELVDYAVTWMEKNLRLISPLDRFNDICSRNGVLS